MAKAKKQKVVVRELKSKIKVIESAAKEPIEEEKAEEAPLEELIVDAPSSREFPALPREPLTAQVAEKEPETRTPAATTEAESSAGARYAVQTNVSESEIRRVYQSRIGETKQMSREQTLQIPELRDAKSMFRNREVESLRAEQEDEKYSIEFKPKEAVSKRKLPWEA